MNLATDNDSMARVVLAGNPNSGKTSLFNRLTGARQHVGNYPGVTVESREGKLQLGERTVRLEDLPGTYGLEPWSAEEKVAREELIDHRPDAAVIVVDSSAPERGISFYLQVQLAGIPTILCLNMADEARDAGQVLDVSELTHALHGPVVETVAHTGEGVDALLLELERILEPSEEAERPAIFHGELAVAIGNLSASLGALPNLRLPAEYLAMQVLAGTVSVEALAGAGQEGLHESVGRARREVEESYGQDIAVVLASAFFDTASRLVRRALLARARVNARVRSDRVDRLLANRILGLPLFLALMFGLFWVTFTLGDYPVGWLQSFFGIAGDWIVSVWPPGKAEWLLSLIVDGLIGGVGGVVVFVPNIVLLFLGLALLEDTGYMARGAFIMDRFMRRFGLHGKSFIPMVCGFGCSIPGIMGTRILEDEKDRLLTMFVLPLMSCGARLPIWLLLVPAFFPPVWRAPVLWGIYFFGVIVALLLALVLRRTVFKGDETPFIMELPPYRLPTPRALLGKMWERSWLYLRKAGTVILGISVVMWVITAYPKPDSYEVDRALAAGELSLVAESIPGEPGSITELEAERRRQSESLRASLAGQLGTFIEPVIAPLGFDWKLGVAMVGSFAAKEVFVSQMAIVYSLGGEEGDGIESLSEYISRDYSPAAGVALILFLLIATPCMATLAVTRRESGTWRFALLQFSGLTLLGYGVALIAYQIVSLFC
jgi:ferrous iron transport protein B